MDSETTLKRLVQLAIKLEIMMRKGNYNHTLQFLNIIANLDKQAFYKIERETRSKELMEQCLKIRELALEAIVDIKRGSFERAKQVVMMIINSGERLLQSEEHFVGYSIHEYARGSVGQQAGFLSDFIEGITTPQAFNMLNIAYEEGMDVVIGGSSLVNHRVGGDLDVGFKVDPQFAHKFPHENLRDIVRRAVNRINKICFGVFEKELGHQLVLHKWLHDRSALTGIPDITNVEEFFMRSGFRSEPKVVLKDGRPFGPSGYAIFYPSGRIIVVTPSYRKGGVVGKARFW